MAKILRDIYRDDLPPQNKNMLWHNILDDKLYSFRDGTWRPIKCQAENSDIFIKDSIYNDQEIIELITRK